MIGLSAYGGYIPRYRLNRMEIFKAMGWMNPGLITTAKGEKAVANFDEDSLTLATAAGQSCLQGLERSKVDGVYFASTTSPFRERQSSNVIAGALCAPENIRSADFAGSLRSGTSALLSAIEKVGYNGGNMVVTAADCRLGRTASPQEMYFGDAAAALLVSDKNVIAEFKGSYSLAEDFVDHFRGANSRFNRQWEERWVRELGFNQFIPLVAKRICEQSGMAISDFAKVVFPCYMAAARKEIVKGLGLDPAVVQDDLQALVGDAGSAQPLLMLAAALETAAPGDKILLISYGNGCDAMIFEVTKEIEKLKNRQRISASLNRKHSLDNYQKMLVWRDMIPVDAGMRGEEDQMTRWSLEWRYHETVLGLQGSKCNVCGTQQFPPQRICANSTCGAIDQMTPVNLSEGGGKIFSYTADSLASSVNPPAVYGNIEFEGGGRAMMDFTDCTAEDVAVGDSVDFSFRIKRYDPKRDVTFYFWKAIPAGEEVS